MAAQRNVTFTSTRRQFLAGSLAAAAGTAVLATSARADTPPPADAAGRCLLLVQLAGGNDPWNTLVPAGDANYHANRPTRRSHPSPRPASAFTRRWTRSTACSRSNTGRR